MASKVARRGIAFVAHSFAPRDVTIIKLIKRIARSTGYSIVSGEAPAPTGVSYKVRTRIESSSLLIAILTRRHCVGASVWTTSPWVIEEKAYSLGDAKDRPIVLCVETGVAVPGEIGGINGDLEYITFDRYRIDLLARQLRALLRSLHLRES